MYNCEILNMFDANNDRVIDTQEQRAAVAVYDAGKITLDEYLNVEDAWLMGEDIGAICPDRVEDVKKVFIPFAVAAVIVYVVTKLIWR